MMDNEQQPVTNTYLQQVREEKKMVERDLVVRKKRSAIPNIGAGSVVSASSEPAPAVDLRITGWWRWKNVIVPPNTYVVHTRKGHDKPIDIGLGLSFNYDPHRDSFMVVPSAMQTIIISANCVCKERQGILVQGYVQWMIEDFSVAYRKLDFSDPVEPMRVVNVQLREQAEATIKDTVATMSIDDVLSDKQPIIQELTTRLKGVTEGGEDDEGLGLRIVTVQIKEAVISSARLWSSLQRPFRAERAKTARLAELGHESEVTRTEAQEQKRAAMLNIDKEAEISLHTDQASAESFDRQEQERARRAVLEAKLLADSVAHERTKLATEAEIDRLKLENHLLLEKLKGDAAAVEARREIELSGLRQKVENDLSEARIKAQLIRALPKVAESMPKANEVKAITLGGSDTERLVASVKSLVDGFSSN